MIVLNLISFASMAYLLMMSITSPAWAAQLDAVISTKAEFSMPTFKFLRTLFIEYPEGGKLAEELQGKDILISFDADSNTPGISDFISRINNNLAHELESTVFVTDLNLTYRAHLVGKENQAAIDYKIILIPKMTNYVLRQGTDTSPAIIDAQWRGIALKDHITIHSDEFGEVEINTPLSFFEKEIPGASQILKGSDADSLLRNQLIDTSVILSHPLSTWHSLFDPTLTISDAAKFNYKGEKVVTTTYSAGESSLGHGIWKEKREEVKLKLDKMYVIRSVDPASSANIQIDGFVTDEIIDGTEYFGSSLKIPKDYQNTSSNNFPIGVMYGMAGAGAAVAVVVFLWSERKLKKSKNVMTSN
ncbi:MAG TPA: hypothetical protein VLD38_00280 [Nitrosopumilaceae archaeon]|nr:hypothetical protein [Nitrosopumilaceae archaeon]